MAEDIKEKEEKEKKDKNLNANRAKSLNLSKALEESGFIFIKDKE